MKRKKFLIIITSLCIIGTSLISCTDKVKTGGVVNENNLSNDEIERLPDEQKDSELDKKIAAMRKFRKNNKKSENGSMTAISQVDTDLVGQTKNRPPFDEVESKKQVEVVSDYLGKKFNIDINDEEEFNKINQATCIDPRINAIYDDDKGVANGYKNEEIYIEEYEDSDGTYKYLILIKDKETKEWTVIHDGDGYKK